MRERYGPFGTGNNARGEVVRALRSCRSDGPNHNPFDAADGPPAGAPPCRGRSCRGRRSGSGGSEEWVSIGPSTFDGDDCRSDKQQYDTTQKDGFASLDFS